MPDIDFPPGLVDLQRRVDAAWVKVEAHRKAVDAERRAEAAPTTDPTRKWESPALRSWTPKEDGDHAALLGEATQAAGVLRQALTDAGLGHGYDVVQGLHKAARAQDLTLPILGS